MAIPYLRYKEFESDLQEYLGKIKVTVESITSEDVYYTDGDAANSSCKLIISGNELCTVYIPQVIYNFPEEYRRPIEQWMVYVYSKLK